MKKDDFKKSIDSINPDAYMGNRLKAKITTVGVPFKSYKRITLSVTSLCLAVAIIVGIGFGTGSISQFDVPQNIVENIVPQKDVTRAFIMVSSASKTEDTVIATENNLLEMNEEYPYEVYLEVRNISGLSDAEVSEVIEESKSVFDNYCAEKTYYIGRSTVSATNNIVMVQCTFNEFILDLENIENVRSINVKNTSRYGEMVLNYYQSSFVAPEHGNDLTIFTEDYGFETPFFYWEPTEEIEKVFGENINTPFSTFNDTITFTVEYKDGSKEIGVVDLVFDDSGKATAVCKGYDYIE